jgi:hypothetical protein
MRAVPRTLLLVAFSLPADSGADAASGSPVGSGGCTSDTDCASNVCWDFAEYDPLCGGTVCSVSCTTDAECVDAARTAGATSPDGAACGSDGRCDLVSTGLPGAAFVCA